MTYEKTVDISRKEYERVNNLLALYSLSEMTDQELLDAGANTHQCEGLFYVKFEDGSELTYDLCSGTEDYYDDVVWHNDDMDVVLECTFELSNIEFEIEGNTYKVKLNII